MAAPKKTTSGNADAFDDLLGQLVDELAMTPTMVPEPEPPPPPHAASVSAAPASDMAIKTERARPGRTRTLIWQPRCRRKVR